MKIIRLIALWGIAMFAFTGAAAQTPMADAGLPGSSWLLTATSGQDHQTLALPNSNITLNFDSEGKISGNGGCNGYGGVYTLGEAGEIALSEIVSTLMACEDTQLTTQESIYLSALGGVTHYELTDQQLTLRIGDLESLHFVRADQDPLVGTTWELVNEIPAEATPEAGGTGQPITLTFESDGQVYGHGGCNSFSGAYVVEGTGIAFQNIASTRRACGEDIMQREQDFFAALSNASQYGLTDERLYIRNEDGSRLAFEKVEAASLTASPLSGAAGTQVELTGSGFAPNSEIVIGFGPFVGDVYEPIAQAESDADGAFTVTVTVPEVADPAVEYVFMAAVPGTARTLSESFTVRGI